MSDGPPLFHERQRFTQPWLWAVLAAISLVVVAVGAVLLLVRGATSGGLAVIAYGLLAPAVLALFVLDTEVRPDGLHLRFVPLVRHRHLRPEEIVEATARSYRPIVEYGGWGVRWGKGGKCYTVSGDRGVQLALAGGERLLVGSQRAEELAAAIAAVKR
ncbi:MAG TPA: hypothetical protein VHM02_00120 [Thermoanaerobaculia bacterium]|nr:hypothetical protein [Thermoanaerobaculia bacterium]